MRIVSLGMGFLVAMSFSVTAARADEAIGLSNDGVSWAQNLPAPLFDAATRWVPGDVRTASFFVRSNTGAPAELSVDLRGAGVDTLLETGDLSISARGAGGHWRSTHEPGFRRLVSSVAVSGPARVDVQIVLADDASNVSQLKSLEVDLRVHLQQSLARRGGDRTASALPRTGGPQLGTAVAGVLLLAGGIALASSRRKEDRHDI